MLTTLALSLLTQDDPTSAAAIVSKMIARYHEAKTIKGTVTTTVKINEQSYIIDSSFQLERPGRLYLRQSVQNIVRLLTCDGKNFTYNKPLSAPDSDRNLNLRLMEPLTPTMSLGDVYHAASESLAELSAPLDLAIGDLRDLRRLRDQWETLDLTGETDVKGTSVYRIVGKWRLGKGEATSGNFGIYVTKEGDLKRYVVDNFPAELEPGQRIKGSREYDVDLHVGAELDLKLFTLVK